MSRRAYAIPLVALAVLASTVAGCAPHAGTTPGDRLLGLPRTPVPFDERALISTTMREVAALLESFPLPKERVLAFSAIKPSAVVREEGPLDLLTADHQIILSRSDVRISFAMNAVVIAAGSIQIAHSANSIVVSGGDVTISHDGVGGGSLVASKGKTRISHAADTLIHAGGGTEVSFARNVHAFNTEDRVTSWGRIDNVLIEPLFQDTTTGR